MCSSGGGTGRSLMSPCSVEDTGRAGQGELNGQAAGAHAAAARCSCTGGLGGLCMGAGGWFIGKPRPTRLGSSDGADFHSDMVTAHGKTAHGASVKLSWYRVLSTASACDMLCRCRGRRRKGVRQLSLWSLSSGNVGNVPISRRSQRRTTPVTHRVWTTRGPPRTRGRPAGAALRYHAAGSGEQEG